MVLVTRRPMASTEQRPAGTTIQGAKQSSGAGEPLLQVRNLSTTFMTDRGVVRAVDDISFHVNPRETLCVVGESGSGKSVTALSVMRLIREPPGRISGEIHYRGQDLLRLPLSEMMK